MQLDPVVRLTRDLKEASKTLAHAEARFLVDAYYSMQHDRIRAANQVRAMGDEPHSVLSWLGANSALLEGNIKRALGAYASAHIVGQWSQGIMGIGPVISAGLLAHIDIEKAPTVGHIWRFAGLDPTVAWEKGERRPWNSSLKTLCWKIGESFVKVSGRDRDFYGKLYLERKAFEQGRNDAGQLAEQAAAKLEKYRIGKTTDAYKVYAAGMLPPAHIHARAKRWAVKLFLSHWHDVQYRAHFRTSPPLPYVLTPDGGHAHRIEVPNQ